MQLITREPERQCNQKTLECIVTQQVNCYFIGVLSTYKIIGNLFYSL